MKKQFLNQIVENMLKFTSRYGTTPVAVVLLLFIFVPSVPGLTLLPPVLTHPSSSATDVGRKPTFEWEEAANATAYNFELWRNGHSTLVTNIIHLDTNKFKSTCDLAQKGQIGRAS